MSMSKHELVLKDCKTVIEGKIVECSIGVDHGKISAIKKILSGDKEIDCSHKLVLPGMVDVHVHFREPGMEQKANWRTESEAALHGGVTTVCDMPNNKPSICTMRLLERKRRLVSNHTGVDFGLHFGVSPKHLNEIPLAKNFVALKIFMGSSTGDLLVSEREQQLEAFKAAAEVKKIAMVHAEDNTIIKELSSKAEQKRLNDVSFHSIIRPVQAEVNAVKQAIKLQKKAGNKLHVCHVSSIEALNSIPSNKNISCGVTPNHLFLSNKDLPELKNFGKLNPPLRGRRNRIKLFKAFAAGKFNIVESDHAPHLRWEKKQDYLKAPPGIPGVETTLPLLIDAFQHKLISLERIVESCCHEPARLFGIKNKGFIGEGFDADFAVFDLKKDWRVNSDDLLGKCGWSPFEGRKLNGLLEKTFLRGELRHEEGQVFSGEGKEIELL